MPLDTAYIRFPPHTSRDALAPLRVAVLKKILPRRCSTMLSVKCNKTNMVPHVDGQQFPKPGHILTAPEILPIFDKESALSGKSACNARKMLRIMTLKKGEAWTTAGRRVASIHTGRERTVGRAVSRGEGVLSSDR